MKKRLKVNGIIIILSLVLVALFPGVFLRRSFSATLPDEMLDIIGVALILLGQVIRVSARGYKAEHSQNSQVLIQGGLYSIVRNPMYLGILLIGIGVVLLLFNWWAALLSVLLFISRYILLIFKEERKLERMFPGTYHDYCARVPRLIPRLSAIIQLDISEYLPLKLSWLKKDIGSMLALLFVVISIESWEDILKDGVSVYLREFAWILLTISLFIGFIFLLSRRAGGSNGNLPSQG